MCLSNAKMLHIVRYCKRIYHQYGLGHLLLFLFYAAYLLLGASLFLMIERGNSARFRNDWTQQLNQQRRQFVEKELLPDLFNNSRFLIYIHERKARRLANIVREKLLVYESRLRIRPPMPYLEWTFTNSLLFTWSTITTIGYGFIYPVTNTGRTVSVIYSIFGIPFTIVVVNDLAVLLATVLGCPVTILDYLWLLFRYLTLQPVDDEELRRKLHKSGPSKETDSRMLIQKCLLNIPTLVAVFALIGWLSVGASIMVVVEDQLNTWMAFYFLFNTLATIGVGDIEPRNSTVLMCLFIYVIVGLALVSLFVNLMHSKFSKAYWTPDWKMSKSGRKWAKMASFDSESNALLADDDQLNHYVTMGVFRAEERRRMLRVLGEECSCKQTSTQTHMTTLQKSTGETILMQGKMSVSNDDVQALMTETYSGRPARFI